MRLVAFLAASLTLSCATARMAGRDVVEVAKAPATEWKKVAVAAAVVGAATLADDEIADVARKNDGAVLDKVTKVAEPFGGGHSDKVMAAFLLAGIRDEKARRVAFDAIVSTTIASKGVTPALKQLVGRERPGGGDDPSFPSGHATQAFALATVIASHYDQRWVRWLAYGVAVSVGAARLYHDDHWTSDVLAGAAIGSFVARTVVVTNRGARAAIVPRRNGVTVSLTW